MAAEPKVPGTEVRDGGASTSASVSRARPPKDGHLVVGEMTSDKPAAPSPFGDDQEFPLPVDQLTYTPTLTP